MENHLSLLLVEDDLALLEELKLFLSDFFNDIVTMTTSEDAYKVFLERSFDLVITDIRLPQQSGLNLVEKVKKKNPDQCIIVMSAYNDIDYFLKSIELKIYGFLTKPFDSQKLISMMLKVTSELVQAKNKTHCQDRVQLSISSVFDVPTKSLYVNNVLQELTQKEELLLDLLVKHQNHFVSTELIAKNVWEIDEVNNSTLRALIKRLRDKLGCEESITNLKGRGYKLNSIFEAE